MAICYDIAVAVLSSVAASGPVIMFPFRVDRVRPLSDGTGFRPAVPRFKAVDGSASVPACSRAAFASEGVCRRKRKFCRAVEQELRCRKSRTKELGADEEKGRDR